MTGIKVATSIDFKILLRDDDISNWIVVKDHVFKIGQAIKLEVVANNDVYLYVLYQGQDGVRSLLMPGTGGDGKVPRALTGETKVIPQDGTYFQFVPPAGIEKLIIFATPAIVPELKVGTSLQDADGKHTPISDMIFQAAENAKFARSIHQADKGKSKDIVFRHIDITDDDGTTVMVGSSDASRKPEVCREILLKSR